MHDYVRFLQADTTEHLLYDLHMAAYVVRLVRGLEKLFEEKVKCFARASHDPENQKQQQADAKIPGKERDQGHDEKGWREYQDIFPDKRSHQWSPEVDEPKLITTPSDFLDSQQEQANIEQRQYGKRDVHSMVFRYLVILT